ncbi:hypothetical protein PF005_g29172 [Phytophthora fragariae]|uniref:Integrase zinc-binding domain-containing protein n=1 Tax=Phytophthora fragariae TaxID=53985 RepID=A0A6A3VSB2_9STRA|nr:hypothetical protein PF005_g29172 [Phytophthora fragariae]
MESSIMSLRGIGVCVGMVASFSLLKAWTMRYPPVAFFTQNVGLDSAGIFNDETLGDLSHNTRNPIGRYHLYGDLLCYNIDQFDAPRVVVPNDDDLRDQIIHDSPMGEHLGREKTLAAVSRDFL